MAIQREIKIFEASAESAQGPVLVPFGLTFTNKDDPTETEVHEFEARCAPGDAGMVLALSSVAHVDTGGKRQVDLNGLLYFFKQVMPEADYTRLGQLLFERDDITIHIDVLSEVTVWLMEEFSGRPTGPASRSSRGRQATGRPSTGQASLQVATS